MAKKKEKSTTGRSKRRERAIKQKQKQQQGNIIRFSLAGLIVAGILAFMLWPKPVAAEVSAERISLNPSVGSTEPVVTVTEYADFGCPACQAWHNSGIKDRILETYGDSVQFVWQDYPVITLQSPKAAEAGQCALDQGLFWEYHDAVYERHSGLSNQALKAYAQQAGLNNDEFANCLDSSQHQATVQSDLNAGRELRLRGTPSFAVNGQLLAGPPGYEQLASLIENALQN